MEDYMWNIFRFCFEFNVLLVPIAMVIFILIWTTNNRWFGLTYQISLKISYILIILSFVIPIIRLDNSAHSLIRPLVKNYSGVKAIDFKKSAIGKKTIQITISGLNNNAGRMDSVVKHIDYIVLFLSLLGLMFFLYQYTKTHIRLKRLLNHSFLIKRYKRFSLYISDNISGPFSCLFLNTKLVLLPNYLLADKKAYSIALKHEIQHHRQKDTFYIYIFEIIRCLFFYNPFSWTLLNQIHKLQELTCDELLIGRNEVSSSEYGRCLVSVAEYQSGLGHKTAHDGLVGTTSLSASAFFIKRRILAMSTTRHFSKFKICILLVLVFSFLIGASYGAKSLTKNSRISMKKALELAKEANKSSSIPIFVNQDVLKWLNIGVGTDRGRRYLRSSLKRMKRYERMIKNKLQKYNLPEELLAVPIHESGYQNYDNGIAAGIWSFTPGTARVYGLTVDDDLDERFDERKLTRAAMDYYTHLINRKEFDNNWHLALIAYNSGERRLINAIKQVGSTNALKIIQDATNLKRENRIYLPRLMACLIVLKNPQLLD